VSRISADTPVVLLVEDEEDVGNLYERWLDEYEVRTACDGETALSLLDDDVDAVLLDRRLPDVSGDEVLAAIEEWRPDCPVAMVTGVEPTTDVLELGFADYLVKPVTSDDLRATVERLHRLTAYDDRVQRQFALASKLALMEARVAGDELDDDGEYARLQAELADISRELEQRRDELSDDDFDTLFALTA